MLKKIPHHANLLVGTSGEAELYLHSLCKDSGIEISNNPDLFVFKMEVFGIDEARKLSFLSTRKPVTFVGDNGFKREGVKIFFVAPSRFTLEAQNALLKTLEDIPPYVYFFLNVIEEALILPTLRSRLQTLRVSGDHLSEDFGAEAFLALSPKNRLVFSKKFTDEEKNLLVFLDDLMKVLQKKQYDRKSLEKIYKIRRLSEIASSPRLFIEYLSLVLP